jgi:hypothetical protein
MVTMAATITAETMDVSTNKAIMIMSVVKVVIKECRSSHKVPGIFVEVLCINIHENLSSGSQAFPH